MGQWRYDVSAVVVGRSWKSMCMGTTFEQKTEIAEAALSELLTGKPEADALQLAKIMKDVLLKKLNSTM